MSSKVVPVCGECGAKMVEYTFTFNKGICVFLRALYLAGGVAKTDTLGLTYSQRTNSQKVRYWDLAIPHINEESKKKAGWWQITDHGIKFLRGEVPIHKKVVMYRNERRRYEGEQILVTNVVDTWEYRSDYQEQVRSQGELFGPRED